MPVIIADAQQQLQRMGLGTDNLSLFSCPSLASLIDVLDKKMEWSADELSEDAICGLRRELASVGLQTDEKSTEQGSASAIEEVFAHYDTDGNGTLCKDEFWQLLGALDPSWDPRRSNAVFDAVDTSNSGVIDVHELTKWLFGGTRIPGSCTEPRALSGHTSNTGRRTSLSGRISSSGSPASLSDPKHRRKKFNDGKQRRSAFR